MTVLLPFGDHDKVLVEHGSTVPFPLLAGAIVGTVVEPAASVAIVGDVAGVSVGAGVFVGRSVGGTGVLVGIASCVCATIVKAAASAVC